ncbi:MAG: hypothetical protein EXR52_02760 [Dehalococcoidia bacterium]|nr:hypothetical protein [Dehalococcoidia bacterium]
MAAGPPGPGLRAVVTELHGASSTLWMVNPADPRRRAVLSTVEHADGWGLKAKTSPDSRYVAYLVLPPGATGADRQAELWALDVAAGATRLLGSGLDVLGALRWSPDSMSVVARRTAPDATRRSFTLVGFNPAGVADPVTLATARNVDWAGAVGWWQGAFAYATLAAHGTELHFAGDQALLLTPGIARDIGLQQGSNTASFIELGIGTQPAIAGIASLSSGIVERNLHLRPFGPRLRTGDPANDHLLNSVTRLGESLGIASNAPVAVYSVSAGVGGALGGGYLAAVDFSSLAVRPLAFRGYAEFAGWLE